MSIFTKIQSISIAQDFIHIYALQHTKEYISYSMEQFIQILKDNQAENFAIFEEKVTQRIEKRPEVAEIIQRKSKFIEGMVTHDVSCEKYSNILAKLQQAGIPCDITRSLPVGAVFGDYGELDNVLDEDKSVLKHIQGEVLLVEVWGTTCGPCQKPMQHNHDMLEKNKTTWGENVRMVAVSIDDQKSTVVERVNYKKWHRFQHLTLLGWNGQHKLLKDFSVNGIPFVCLVNKFGKIDYIGHPDFTNIEERIHALLAQIKEEDNVNIQAQKPCPQQKYPDLSNVLTVANISNKFAGSELLAVKAETTTKYDRGVISSKKVITVHVFEGDKESIQIINKEFAEVPNLIIKEVPFVTPPIQENPACWQCKINLNYPYYWLKWEEGTHFGCRVCVEKKSTKQGHHFNYEKNSILLIGKWDKIAAKGLGSNIQPSDLTQQKQGHMFGCNICGAGSELGQVRYICLGCRADPNPKGDYVDICETCIEDIAQGKQIHEVLKMDHHCANHPFLRVLYNVQNYYEF